MQKDVERKERCGVCGVLMLSKCVSLPKIIIEISHVRVYEAVNREILSLGVVGLVKKEAQ